MTHHLEQNTQRMRIPRGNGQEPEPQPIPQAQPDEIQDIYVLILREREEDEQEPLQVVESTLIPSQQLSLFPAYVICCLYLLLVVGVLAFQVYCLLNPLEATVTILTRAQQVSMRGTFPLGRLLPLVTFSQAQTVPATGTGHQDARSASGTLTFYNGQFQVVTIPAGTVLGGIRGIPVVTDQQAVVPAGNPPSYGQVSVPAHAEASGVSGNIEVYDINHACCATSLLVANTTAFTGGQDEREFATVASQDIARVATLLIPAVARSITGALQGQDKPAEQVVLLPCRPVVSSDGQVGQEASKVTVTVSETCRAVDYNSRQLTVQATALLSTLARQQLGSGYSAFGAVHVAVKQAIIAQRSTVVLSFTASGTWVYGLSQHIQAQIIRLLVGKTTRQAERNLSTLGGVERASIRFSGFGDESRLPRQSHLLNLVFLVA
jgi:hypothetical protein